MNPTYAAAPAPALLDETRRVLQRAVGTGICVAGAVIHAIQMASVL